MSEIKELLAAHETLDETRFGHVTDTLDEVKEELKELRQENTQQHKESRQETDKRFDKLEAKLDVLSTPAKVEIKTGFIENLSKKEKVIGVIILVAIGAKIGWEGFIGLIDFFKGLIGL